MTFGDFERFIVLLQNGPSKPTKSRCTKSIQPFFKKAQRALLSDITMEEAHNKAIEGVD